MKLYVEYEHIFLRYRSIEIGLYCPEWTFIL